MKKIAIITPMLQPYRITFYEKLAYFDVNYQWIVFHGVSSNENGRPNFQGKTNFQNQGFREYKFFIGPYTIVYNRGMYSEIRKYNPDLVILQGIAGDISNRRVASWARRNHKKIILWTCGWEPGIAKGKFLSFKNHFVSTYFKKADMHLTYSTKASRYTESMGVEPGNIRTSYNGIETDDLIIREADVILKSKEVKEKYELSNFITFLYVGGLLPEKKVDLLLYAFRTLRNKYSNIKLLIIGDGPQKRQIIQMISEMSDNQIYYLGRVVNEVDQYFAASDCLVLPGVGGLALNQGMFWRKTCIVSEADGTEDDLIIDNETGYRFEPNNVESLAEAMERRLKTSPDDLVKMSEKAREIIDTKSNVNNMVNVFMSSVKDLLTE